MSKCKCGSVPKKSTPPIVTLRLQDLAEPNYFFIGVFISLPPPPSIFSIVWAESADKFCARDPKTLNSEFAPYSTEASTNALKKLWYKSCECAPEIGIYRINVLYSGFLIRVPPPDSQVIFNGETPFLSTFFPPKNLRINRIEKGGGRQAIVVDIDKPDRTPYRVGAIIEDTDSRFRFRQDGLKITFEPSGCYSAPSPPNLDEVGDYPSFPTIPYPTPPPVAFLPEEPRRVRISTPPPIDDCCDCC